MDCKSLNCYWEALQTTFVIFQIVVRRHSSRWNFTSIITAFFQKRGLHIIWWHTFSCDSRHPPGKEEEICIETCIFNAIDDRDFYFISPKSVGVHLLWSVKWRLGEHCRHYSIHVADQAEESYFRGAAVPFCIFNSWKSYGLHEISLYTALLDKWIQILVSKLPFSGPV